MQTTTDMFKYLTYIVQYFKCYLFSIYVIITTLKRLILLSFEVLFDTMSI